MRDKTNPWRANPRPDEQKSHTRSRYVDEGTLQSEVRYCPEHIVINGAGTWGESCYTLPGETCRERHKEW